MQPRQPGGYPAATGGLPGAKEQRAGTPPVELARVEVVFYKEILDHRGFPHHCELARVLNESVELDDAIAGAILAFERAQRVCHWRIAADGYDVET